MSRGRVTVTWQPLTQWPAGRAHTTFREDAAFTRLASEVRTVGGGQVQQVSSGRQRIPLGRTLEDLDRELHQINAKDVVVQIDVAKDRELTRLSDLTNVKSPSVVLTFTRSKEPLVFACDYFKRWQDNLRAIALGLEGLRRLERYHIAQSGDQYRGWKALPSTTTPAFSSESAANVLGSRSNQTPAAILRDREIARKAYREAASNSHPDAPSGSTTDFQLVQEAKRVLEAHHGGQL